MEISMKALKKAKAKLKKSYLLKLCLKTQTCPLCAEDLIVTIDDNRNLSYTCTYCFFTWPQKILNKRIKT